MTNAHAVNMGQGTRQLVHVKLHRENGNRLFPSIKILGYRVYCLWDEFQN